MMEVLGASASGIPPGSPLGVSASAAEVETEVEDNDEEGLCDTLQAPTLYDVPEELSVQPSLMEAEGEEQRQQYLQAVFEHFKAQDGDEDDAEDKRALALASRPQSAASNSSSSRQRPPSAGAAPSVAGSDYQVSEAGRELWKQFGCDTKAGRALRGLYGNGNRVQDAQARVSYPRLDAPASRWEPKKLPRKPCPQQASVRVPRPNAYVRPDRDDPRNWPADLPCPRRKPAAEILAEMEAAKPEVPDMPLGRDQTSEKHKLQDRFRYCGGRMMPKGAMGNVPAGEVPQAVARELRSAIDPNGMNAEQREIFQELVQAIQRKQERIAEIDAEELKENRPSKKRTERNKEALELKNAIGVCLKDIDKLLAMTSADQ